MKLKLRPLSELIGDQQREDKLFVWASFGIIQFVKRDTLVGVQGMHDWGSKVAMPDGWCEPIEIEGDADAANG